MRVRFKTKRLENYYREHQQAVRRYGDPVARRYIERVNIIKASADFETLKSQRVLRCHALKGELAGKWAIYLTGRYRLIFSLIAEEPTAVLIEEVSNHYDD